ncbi:hypothetical protein DMN91_008140 [Ooceraea biroi]|uniref:Uncharacterized protein n=1 Tax=Ooceraea biroi TaxID=2015173 RepID=A0A3L8DHF2_OOCBI|nr:hypothetical protein DMN91_008140 [Ooceraea biroi]
MRARGRDRARGDQFEKERKARRRAERRGARDGRVAERASASTSFRRRRNRVGAE